jgi:hypothetical protein
MVYVVERYLSSLSRADLLAALARLEPAIEERREEGPVVRHLGSTIVLGDEACFCEFDGLSERRSRRPTAEPACRLTGSSPRYSFIPIRGEMRCLSPLPFRGPTGVGGPAAW